MSFSLALGVLPYVYVGRKGKGKMADGKKRFSMVWIPALVHWHKLNYTQPVLACVHPSCQCTLSVQENSLHFPINSFVAMEGQPHSAFLARAMTSKGVSGAGTFLLEWEKSRRKTAAQIGHSCSADACFFPALMLTDTKTNIKERNKWNVCASMLFQHLAMSVVESVTYFVIH